MFYRREAVRVSLAYRYHNPRWDLAKNQSVYGADHSATGLGGNMTLWLERRGQLAKETRLLIPENSLQEVRDQAKALLDHRCLFEVEPWFEAKVPSLENIALFVHQKTGLDLALEESRSWSVVIAGGQTLLMHTVPFGLYKIQLAIGGAIDPESGLIASRQVVLSAVETWKKGLQMDKKPLLIFNSLKEFLPALVWLRIERARSEAIEISLAP